MNDTDKAANQLEHEELAKLLSIKLSGLTFEERVELRTSLRRLATPTRVQKGEAERLQTRTKALLQLRRQRVGDELARLKGAATETRIFFRQFPKLQPPHSVIIPYQPSVRDWQQTWQQHQEFQAWLQQQQAQDPCTPIPFSSGWSSFPGLRNILDVRGGLLGWGASAGDTVEKTITGDGSQAEVGFTLHLTWQVQLPAGGAFIIRRNPSAFFPSYVTASGRHRVIASGWAGSGYDASVSVFGGMFVQVVEPNFQTIEFGPIESSDSTRSEDREKRFSQILNLPDEIVVVANTAASLYIVVFLDAELFADSDDNDSLAYLRIDSFGLPMNTFADASSLWRLCP